MTASHSSGAGRSLRDYEKFYWAYAFGRASAARLSAALKEEINIIDQRQRALRTGAANSMARPVSQALSAECAASLDTALRAIATTELRDAITSLRAAHKKLAELENHVATIERLSQLAQAFMGHVNALQRTEWRKYSTLRALSGAIHQLGPQLLDERKSQEAAAVAKWAEGELDELFVQKTLERRLQEDESVLQELVKRREREELGWRRRILDAGEKLERAALDNAREIDTWLRRSESGTEDADRDQQDSGA